MIGELMGRFSKHNFSRGISYLKRNGVSSSIYKVLERISRDRSESEYDEFAKKSKVSQGELARQHEEVFEHPYKISILVPIYETDYKLFVRMLESVARQSYGNWELCIADASSSNDRRAIVREFCEEWNLKCKDRFGDIFSKVNYKYLDCNKGISGNTNEALKMAHGDYIALLDHDDVIEPDALYMFMKKIQEVETDVRDGEINLRRVYMAYSDEDKVDENDSYYFDYHKKPSFDPILLLTNNYICHFLLVEINLAKSVGGFHSEYDGAQDHDFILRCSESISPEQIVHIPKVLYHWRSTLSSTAENPNAKLYAYEAGIRAVTDHLKRQGISAVVENTQHLGFYRVSFGTINRSVCEMSYSEFKNLTKAQFDLIQQEFLMILSENLKPVEKDYLAKMLNVMQLKRIGAVTGKIIAKSGRIESAGYDKIDDSGYVPRFAGLNRHYSGYMHRADIAQLVGGFTNECVLIRKAAVAQCDSNNIELKSSFGIFYQPEAVFKR